MKRQFTCLALGIVLLCPFASAQWVQTSGPYGGYVTALAIVGTNLFAGIDSVGAVHSGKVFISTDNGASWSPVDSGLSNLGVLSLAVNGSNLYAGTRGGVFLSTNKGASWSEAGLTNKSVTCFAFSETSLFAGTYGDGIFLSGDNGANLVPVDSGLTNRVVNTLALMGKGAAGFILFAGTGRPRGVGDGFFRSTDGGTSWTAAMTGLPWWGMLTTSIAIVDTELFAGESVNGIFRSIDDAASWTATGLTATGVYSLATNGTHLIAGTSGYGVFVSADHGTTWIQTGLTNQHVPSLIVNGEYLFAGTWGAGVWRRPLSEIISSVEFPLTQPPIQFSLQQNFPNPFNPSTTISYALPRRSNVMLTVFNTLGQQVATLVNGEIGAGFHSVEFNAAGLASGAYFYKLQGGSYVDTKRLLLIR